MLFELNEIVFLIVAANIHMVQIYVDNLHWLGKHLHGLL